MEYGHDVGDDVDGVGDGDDDVDGVGDGHDGSWWRYDDDDDDDDVRLGGDVTQTI